MLVPKMVKNGYKSVLCVRVTCWRLFSEWKIETSANTKMGIKTIFDQFRNSHARGICNITIEASANFILQAESTSIGRLAWEKTACSVPQ
jgi:hypothetical protein